MTLRCRIAHSRLFLAITICSGIVTPGASAQQRDTTTLLPTRQPLCNTCLQAQPVGFQSPQGQQPRDTLRQHAIQYSDAYGIRLKIHQIGSYLEFPLFGAEYFVGQKLLNDETNNPFSRSSMRGPHGAIAAGLEGLFAVNTVTGLWNLYDERQDPAGRTRRWLHSLAMLAADAGFMATAGSAESARETNNGASQHRSLAIGSMGLATAATLMMWLWKD